MNTSAHSIYINSQSTYWRELMLFRLYSMYINPMMRKVNLGTWKYHEFPFAFIVKREKHCNPTGQNAIEANCDNIKRNLQLCSCTAEIKINFCWCGIEIHIFQDVAVDTIKWKKKLTCKKRLPDTDNWPINKLHIFQRICKQPYIVKSKQGKQISVVTFNIVISRLAHVMQKWEQFVMKEQTETICAPDVTCSRYERNRNVWLVQYRTSVILCFVEHIFVFPCRTFCLMKYVFTSLHRIVCIMLIVCGMSCGRLLRRVHLLCFLCSVPLFYWNIKSNRFQVLFVYWKSIFTAFFIILIWNRPVNAVQFLNTFIFDWYNWNNAISAHYWLILHHTHHAHNHMGNK